MTEGTEDASGLAVPDVCVVEVGVTNSQASILDLERRRIETIIDKVQRYDIVFLSKVGLLLVKLLFSR